MEPVISVKKLSVVYDQGLPAETTALKNITLDVYPEEFLVIFGPSGCGKS
ncbi:MAG: ABC transporter ATP-binding protein, partial [Candidatus Colwellbacteria bacterium]|nr:ABC transporter ATP-binding protein [Candidatus Colwellbacteria bacterium]